MICFASCALAASEANNVKASSAENNALEIPEAWTRRTHFE
jgi:hypothetical protein